MTTDLDKEIRHWGKIAFEARARAARQDSQAAGYRGFMRWWLGLGAKIARMRAAQAERFAERLVTLKDRSE